MLNNTVKDKIVAVFGGQHTLKESTFQFSTVTSQVPIRVHFYTIQCLNPSVQKKL